MTAAELDVLYTHLCRALAAVDDADTEHFLARLTILLIAGAEPGRVATAIDAAGAGLSRAASDPRVADGMPSIDLSVSE